MSYIAATDFVCCADGDGTAWTGFWTEVSLFLDYHYYSVACGTVGISMGSRIRGRRNWRGEMERGELEDEVW